MSLASETELRQHWCCFTGHRPEKLDQPERVIVAGLEREIRAAVNDGFMTFISGMARGVDIWAAEIVLRFKAEGLPLHLICAIPYQGFEAPWPQEWQLRYSAVLSAADEIVFVCSGRGRRCYQLRNKWMVDRSARLIAVFNGEPGGTKNTIDYAARVGVPTIIIK